MKNKKSILKKSLGFLPALLLTLGMLTHSQNASAQPARGDEGGGENFIPYCYIQGGQYEVLMINDKELDFYLANDQEGDDFAINNVDDIDTNDLEDCAPPAPECGPFAGCDGGNVPEFEPNCNGPECDPPEEVCDPATGCEEDTPNDVFLPVCEGPDCEETPPAETSSEEPSDTEGEGDSEGATECPEAGFSDYGDRVGASEYEKAVATWARCYGVVHGHGDNNKYFSPNEYVVLAHWDKMLARAAAIAKYQHVLGSDVEQYYNLLLNQGVTTKASPVLLLQPVDAQKISEMTSQVLGREVSIGGSGFVQRDVALEFLYDLFAE